MAALVTQVNPSSDTDADESKTPATTNGAAAVTAATLQNGAATAPAASVVAPAAGQGAGATTPQKGGVSKTQLLDEKSPRKDLRAFIKRNNLSITGRSRAALMAAIREAVPGHPELGPVVNALSDADLERYVDEMAVKYQEHKASRSVAAVPWRAYLEQVATTHGMDATLVDRDTLRRISYRIQAGKLAVGAFAVGATVYLTPSAAAGRLKTLKRVPGQIVGEKPGFLVVQWSTGTTSQHRVRSLTTDIPATDAWNKLTGGGYHAPAPVVDPTLVVGATVYITEKSARISFYCVPNRASSCRPSKCCVTMNCLWWSILTTFETHAHLFSRDFSAWSTDSRPRPRTNTVNSPLRKRMVLHKKHLSTRSRFCAPDARSLTMISCTRLPFSAAVTPLTRKCPAAVPIVAVIRLHITLSQHSF
jgi:hypothetical protein